MEFINAVWSTILALAPSLIFGLLIAGILHVFVKKDRISSHLGLPGFRSSMKAALIGVPLPLCSCGVLPAALGLRRDGASKGAVTSFLISTPQTGVDSIAVTWGVLGWPVALAKVIAAFLAGVIGGTITDKTGNGLENAGTAIGCAENETGSIPLRIWNYFFGTIFRDIYRWLALGIIVSALITTFLEPGQLSDYTFLGGPLGLLAALAIGIPLYVCSIASVPIAAGLIYAGFPVGSALVFLMAGPATNAATMGAVRKSLGTRVFLIYILTVIGVSLAAGGVLNSLNISVSGIQHTGHAMNSITSSLTTGAGILLITGIAWFALKDILRYLSKLSRNDKAGSVFQIRIEGMRCSSCEMKVTNTLSELPGVLSVTVSASSGNALLNIDRSGDFNPGLVVRAVEQTGYTVREERHV
ncbi:MAG: permease [Candidatus Aegiribacteria sp.]|nr:permease [Candidatus Aegiribacteria sp.]